MMKQPDVQRRPRVLLDSDGILSDFCVASFDIIEQKTGKRFVHADVKDWNIFKGLGLEEHEDEFYKIISEPGWCSNIPVIEGAAVGVRMIEEIAELVIVTSPMSSATWMSERTEWLKKHLGIPPSRIIHTKTKGYVAGDVFIDDSFDNCVQWKLANPHCKSVLWSAPYNEHKDAHGHGLVKVNGWKELLYMLRFHFNELQEHMN